MSMQGNPVSLADLQRSFCAALRSSGRPPQLLLDQLLDDGLALQRFNVYRNNFVVLNGDALADMYPVIKRLVGDSAFRLLASAYVRRHPPVQRTLLLYGDRFADFLAAIPELSEFPYLPDVARMEFSWTACYHAEDAAPLDRSELAAINPAAFSSARLVPHPSMQCLRSDYPLLRIWESNQPGAAGETVSLDAGPCRLVLIRPHMDVEVRSVSEGAWVFLANLQVGASVEAACALAVRAEADFDLTVFFSRHLLDGTFSSIQWLVQRPATADCTDQAKV